MSKRVVEFNKPSEFKIVLNDFFNLADGLRKPKMWIKTKDHPSGYTVTEGENYAWVFTVDNLLTEGYDAFSYLLRKYHTNITVSAKVELVSFIGKRADITIINQFWEKIKLVLNELELQDNNGGIV